MADYVISSQYKETVSLTLDAENSRVMALGEKMTPSARMPI